MKQLLALFLLVCGAASAEGPVFVQKDTFTQQEFENAYKDIRRFGNATSSMTATINVLVSSEAANNAKGVFVSTTSNIYCIDSPSFCVDTVNNRVGIGTAAPGSTFSIVGTMLSDGNGNVAFGPNASINGKLSGRTDSAEDYRLLLFVNNATGNPYVGYSTNANDWTAGVDNADSDSFKVCKNNLIGSTNAYLIITTTGAVVVTQQLVGKGTIAADNAMPGYYGESGSSVVSSDTNFPGTGVFGDGTSVSLTAGDYKLMATINAESQAGTWSNVSFGVSSSSGTSTTGLSRGNTFLTDTWTNSSATPTQYSKTLGDIRVSQASTVTWYLKVASTYTSGQPQFRCRLSWSRYR